MNREDQPNVIVSVIVTDGSKVLMVQESKPKHKGKWNIPGGHAIRGESVVEAAVRELQEETNIASKLDSLIGVYSSSHSVRFVFRAKIPKLEPSAGHEIQTVAFFTFTEVLLWPDETLVAPKNLNLMLKHAIEGKTYPIEQMIDNR